MFTSSAPLLSLAQIQQAEQLLCFALPAPLKKAYLAHNGGEPDPYVFENDDLDTVVSEFLPLVSLDRRTSVDAYRSLVQQKKIVAERYFPFAVDGGGDYFFVDVETLHGAVYFYCSDGLDAVRSLLALNMGLDDFWGFLKAE